MQAYDELHDDDGYSYDEVSDITTESSEQSLEQPSVIDRYNKLIAETDELIKKVRSNRNEIKRLLDELGVDHDGIGTAMTDPFDINKIASHLVSSESSDQQ